MIANSNKLCLVSRNVDVTGVTSIGEGACIPMQSVQLRRANISFGTVGGNPFSVLEQDTDGGGDGGDGDDDDDDAAASVDSDYSTSSTDSFGLFSGDQHFTNRYCYILDAPRVNHCLLVGKNTKKLVVHMSAIEILSSVCPTTRLQVYSNSCLWNMNISDFA